ncbi:MAG: hypothetical protein KatS3mg005_2048 [Bryobacteraceae bacterium]|nr:MAG: hypothetical protein KatS3mg005_2048 [Bryobacteraceae bacterium]
MTPILRVTRTLYMGAGQWAFEGQFIHVSPEAAETLKRAGLAVDASPEEISELDIPEPQPKRRRKQEK